MSREIWRDLAEQAVSGHAAAPKKRLTAHYSKDRLADVLKFIHSEVGLQTELDVYNIQCKNHVASASVSEPVEEVLSRLGDDVERFVLPMFRGDGCAVRIEHKDLKMVVEGQSFSSLEEIRDRWVRQLGDDGAIFYAITVSGRFRHKMNLQRWSHLLMQIVALYPRTTDSSLTIEHSTAAGSSDTVKTEFNVDGALVSCSDCGGYHPPVVAETLSRNLYSRSFGTSVARFSCGNDELRATVKIPILSYHLSFSSTDLAKVKNVESLIVRSVTDKERD